MYNIQNTDISECKIYLFGMFSISFLKHHRANEQINK